VTAPAIELNAVSMAFRSGWIGPLVPVLDGVSFEVQPGEVFGFLGPNGAGKTTTINILMGFLFPRGGSARVLGLAPGDVGAKRQIGFLPENFAFHRYLTGERLLRFHSRLLGDRSPTEEIQKRALELLERVKLGEYHDLKIGRFSRGMVQRIGLAQAILGDPQLLILDEPTSGLDPIGRREVRELILALKQQGRTILLSSHLLSEVELVCDRIGVIDRGQLKQVGGVADLLGAGNQIEIVVDALAEELRTEIAAAGGSVSESSHALKITLPAALKREWLERLWSAGCDIISLNPRRSSLEDVFVKLVGSPPVNEGSGASTAEGGRP
jgi:ABC-2 type transport system ATP-binding protein